MKWLMQLAGVAFILLANLLGLAAVFSDLGRGESMTQRFLPIAGIYAIGGLAIGFLFEKQWYRSMHLCWGLAIFVVPILLMRILDGGVYLYWKLFLYPVVVVPGVALTSGFMGALLKRRKLMRQGKSLST
jgi:hypothetical protein